QHVKAVFEMYGTENLPLFDSIEWEEADLLNKATLDAAFKDADYVYHAAAIVSFNPADRQRMLHNNIESTANVVDLCLEHDVKKLCHVSSIASLGEPSNGELIHEDTLWKNSKGRSTYSLSKFKSEMEVWRGITEGLNAIIVNPSVILGPGFWNRGSSALISTVARGLRFFPEGGTGFVDVNDVVHGMIGLMEKDVTNGRYILNSENRLYKEVFDMIASCLNVEKPSIRVGRILSSLGWRLEWIRSKLTGSSPKLTREVAEASKNIKAYSNRKVSEVLGFSFQPVGNTIEQLCEMYKAENSR
ncbi:MAG: NAD-dependent epimerase/dehydratase family protein, partial [Bacteroidota bacterium]